VTITATSQISTTSFSDV